MKRREFLATGASAAAMAALPPTTSLRAAPRGPARESYSVGDFILQRAGKTLRVAHRRNPQRVLWQSASDFLVAEKAVANVREFGTPEGSFRISDRVSASYRRPSIEAIDLVQNRATVSGRLTGAAGSVGYTLSFEAMSHELRYQFLLGPDLLVAPVLDKGADAVRVYFPMGSAWTDLWSGTEGGAAGSWSTMPAPLGKPAVFLRKGAVSAHQILSGLKSVGVLT